MLISCSPVLIFLPSLKCCLFKLQETNSLLISLIVTNGLDTSAKLNAACKSAHICTKHYVHICALHMCALHMCVLHMCALHICLRVDSGENNKSKLDGLDTAVFLLLPIVKRRPRASPHALMCEVFDHPLSCE